MRWRGLMQAPWKNARAHNAATSKFFTGAIASRSENCGTSDNNFSHPTTKTIGPSSYHSCHTLESWRSTEDGYIRKSDLKVFPAVNLPSSSDEGREELLHDIHEPDGSDIQSVLRHAHATTIATLSKFPNAHCAHVRHRYRDHSFLCTTSREHSRDASGAQTYFNLRIKPRVYEDMCIIGPRKSDPDNRSFNLGIGIQLLPKPVLFLPRASDGKYIPSMEHLSAKLVQGLRLALRGREFTSRSSWMEAVLLHLRHAINHSALNRYVSLEGLTLHSPDRTDLVFTTWTHEHSRSDISPYFKPLSAASIRRASKQRHEDTLGTNKGGLGAVTRTEQPPRETLQYQVHPFNVTLSIGMHPRKLVSLSDVVSHFEERCSESLTKDLAYVLDSFLDIMQGSSKDVTDLASLKISLETPNALPDLKAHEHTPAFDLELKQAATIGSISLSLRVTLQKSFNLHFKSMNWNKRPIQVKQVTFQMSSIDTGAVASLRDKQAQDQPTIAAEARHLIDRASSVMGKVCEGVEFDDVARVPGMLAEAVLKTVCPKTTYLKLDQVTLTAVIGDDPVALTKTVSSADLDATSSQPQLYAQYVDKIDFPSCYSSNVTQEFSPPQVKAKITPPTGVFRPSSQFISSPIVEYGSFSPLRELNDCFEAALESSRASDMLTLQVFVRNALEKVPGAEEAALILEPSGEFSDYLELPNSQEGPMMAVFADGDVVCKLQTFTEIFAYQDDSNHGKPISMVCRVWLTGTPTKQTSGHIDAHAQISSMHEILAQRYAAVFDGCVFRNVQEAADNIADVSHNARSELAEHMRVHVTTVEVGVVEGTDDGPVSSTRKDKTVFELDEDEAGETLESSSGDIVDRDLEPTEPRCSDESEHGYIASKQESYTQLSSEEGSERKHADALEKLLEELDRKLLSITAPNSEPQATGNEASDSAEYGSSRSKMQRGVVIALGSNLGNRVEEIEKACRAIDADPDMRIVDTSFLYETKPMYVEDQGHFINGACEIETSLSPIQLLDRLQAIEQGHGRVKLVDKGPRNIDLDIAIFRNEVVDSERLTVPHMLMDEREFVLRPIMDLIELRQWVNPRTKQELSLPFGRLVKAGRVKQPQEPMYTVTPLATDTFMYPRERCRQTRVMSILNTTPDSFSDGGSNTLDLQSLRETAAAHIAAGATIIDVGGQSSRPNAPDVTAEEEIARVLPAIAAIKSLPEAEGVAISVDTYRAAVAEAAVNAGAHIINDISAGALDPQMLSTVARLGCTYVMMHMRGTPATMQDPENCVYKYSVECVVEEELWLRVALAIESGVRKWRIILDPGIGFAKTEEQNLELLRRAIVWRNCDLGKLPKTRRKSHMQMRSMPQLFGCSRKGFIGKITCVTEPKDRILGTAAAVTASIRVGADIVRVHDVKEMTQVAKMADALYRHKHNTH